MHNHNTARFKKIMIALAEASGQESTEIKEHIYAKALEDHPIDAIEAAAWMLIKTRTLSSFPKVGEIIELIGGKTEDIAEIEAAKVWKAILSIGGYSSVCFDDPVTQAVIQYGFGGWSKLCGDTMVDQQKWFIKDFLRIYGSYSRQGIKLTGVLEGRGGGPGDRTRLIGNQEKALLVMSTPADKSNFQISSASDTVRSLGYGS